MPLPIDIRTSGLLIFVCTSAASCADSAAEASSAGSTTTGGSTESSSLTSTEATETTPEPTTGGEAPLGCSSELGFRTNRGGGEFFLVRADVNGGDPTAITPADGVVDFSWSPDGSKIAYLTDPTFSLDILVVEVAGGMSTQLVESQQDELRLEWAPRGDRIAFVREGADAYELWVVDAGTGEQTQLAAQSQLDVPTFAWNPEGDTLAVALATAEGGSLQRVPADGGSAQSLVEGMEVRGPAWAPSGAAILFSGQNGSEYGAFTVTPDGGDLQRVIEVFASDLTWSPDETRVVYRGESGDTFRLFVADLAGGAPSELPVAYECSAPSWCDNPNLIATTCTIDAFDRVVLIDPVAGTAETMMGMDGDDQFPAWRPQPL